MILDEYYLTELKNGLINNSKIILEKTGISDLNQIMNDQKVMDRLWYFYQKAIEDDRYSEDLALASAIKTIFGCNITNSLIQNNKPETEYTVIFLFAQKGEVVLLTQKNKTAFIGKLNGIGGKIEAEEKPIENAIRKAKEEAGLTLSKKDLHHLASVRLPYDCKEEREVYCKLHFYCGLIRSSDAKQQYRKDGDTEQLIWMPTKTILNASINDERFAGDGDLIYMVNTAIKRYGFTLSD